MVIGGQCSQTSIPLRLEECEFTKIKRLAHIMSETHGIGLLDEGLTGEHLWYAGNRVQGFVHESLDESLGQGMQVFGFRV